MRAEQEEQLALLEQEKQQTAAEKKQLDEQIESERLALQKQEQDQLEQEEQRRIEQEEQRRIQEAERLRKEQEQEQLRKEQEQERLAAERLQRELEEKARKAKLEEQQRQAALAEKLRRQDEELKKQQEIERKQRLERRAQSEFSKYLPEIKSKVINSWNPLGDRKNRQAILDVEIDPLGEVQSVEIFRSSGSLPFDRSVTNAIRKASPLPIPKDREIFEIIKKFRFRFTEPSG